MEAQPDHATRDHATNDRLGGSSNRTGTSSSAGSESWSTPISPYLQWELNCLKVRAEAGERIRVLAAAKLAGIETSDLFPEVVILGTDAMYEILYDRTGTHSGARRFTRHDVIQACRAEIATPFDQAEDLLPFFEREIAPLPPPRADRP